MKTNDLQLLIDGVPYTVKVTPFPFNAETRFKVEYDGNEYIFAYDSSMGRYASLGDDATNIPDALEAAVAERIENIRTTA